jgi:nitrate reductase gamma subunit
MIFLYLFTYFSLIIFIVLVVSKIIKYSSAPVHVRWELYPVAHEPKKNKYGGSYYEEPEWWKSKNKKSHFTELWAMFEEIIFLKGVFIHNRKLWYFSFPFHLGLYLITATFFLIVLSAVLDLSNVLVLNSDATFIGTLLNSMISFFGYGGLIFTCLGSIGLIFQRMTDKKFKFYNAPMDFINLYFILILGVVVFITLINSNSGFIASKIFVKNLITLNFAAINDVSFIIHVILLSIFFLYFPITRMMHLFAKYFTYHKVRWEDEPNVKGGKLEKKIKEALNFGVSWSAPHIQTGKTWAEVATTHPKQEKK